MKSPLSTTIVQPALTLGLFSFICLLAVSLVFWLVRPNILAQEHAALLANFRAISPAPIEANLLNTAQQLTLAGHSVIVYQTDSGVHFIQATTPKGYSGDITALIGIAPDNSTLLGVRILKHNETPGLGDKIDAHISPWIEAFTGKKLHDTHFAVKKDGGDFDAFTGATITPRAVTGLVGEILGAWFQYAKQHKSKDNTHE